MLKKERLILSVVIALVSLIVYYQFLLKPKAGSLSANFSNLKQMNEKVNQAKIDIASMPKYKDRLKTLQDKVDSYEKRTTSEEELSALLSELSKFAQKNDVKILVIQPIIEEEKTLGKKQRDEKTQQKSEEIYREIPISIEAKATYHNLGFFLDEIEKAERFMEIRDIKIEDNLKTPQLHDVKLIIVTYALPEGKKI